MLNHKHLSAALLTGFLALATIAAPATAADPPAGGASLISNGNFEIDQNSDKWPDGWPHPATGASWQDENGNHFLRLISMQAGQTVLLYREVAIPAGTKALELRWRWRTTDLKPGKEAWFDARVLMNFKDAAGKKLSPAPSAPYLRNSTDGWKNFSATISVPDGARSLEFMPALFQVEKGTLDLDDIVIRAADTAAAEQKAGAVAITDPEPETAQPTKWPQELKVSGNQILNKDGKPVWLQGMNVVSLEWSAKGEHILRSSLIAVDDWKSNLIRLPVKGDFWFGKGNGQKDGGTAYRALIESAITMAANRGAYVLLDLHRFGAPTDDDVAFWKEAAAKYKNHPAVLFDLFNEPHGISWEVWRNGGMVAEKTKPADEDAFTTDAEKAKAAKSFHSPGMQKLITTVREAGARNIVVTGGLDWAYDLSGVAKGFALEDKTGNGIVYSTHIYPWKKGWKEKVLVVAEKYPVLVGEVGCDSKKLSFIPADQQEDPYTWAPDMLGFIQKYKLNWTAFSLHPGASPVMITGWDYTPTPFWGAFVKAALRGGQFGLNRLR
jgi:endoglucanase